MLLHVSTVHRRGDVRIFEKQVRSLSESFREKTVFLVADGKGDSVVEVDENIRIVDMGAARFGRFGRFVFGSLRFLRFAARNRPRVVHFHDFELSFAAVISRVFGCKVVYDVHENIAEQIRSKYWIPRVLRKPLSFAVGSLEQVVGKCCSAIVAATPGIAEQFKHAQLTTIRNFPILSEFEARNSLVSSERLGDFCYVGGISEERGILQMAQAAMQANAKLTLAGSVFPAKLLGDIERREEWGWVDFRGFLDRRQISTTINGSRAGLVLLHPLERYKVSYPVKLFEYMASSIPVIASDFPLWRSIVEKAQCGLLVDPLNVGEIVEAMNWIMDNPEKARLMGERGRSAVEKEYCWEFEATRLIDAYKRLV